MPLSRLVLDVADKQQIQTQISSGRPYGVGLLAIGSDEKGVHLYETNPAGNFYEYYAHAIGARNQAAKTYLEKTYQVKCFVVCLFVCLLCVCVWYLFCFVVFCNIVFLF